MTEERPTITIYAKPTRDEILAWAESALRNCPDGTVTWPMLNELAKDFGDGLSALKAPVQP